MDAPVFGTLYLVATPIGNLEDITYRAVRVLSEVNVIAAEDTRHTRKLLNHYAIKPPKLIACHDHNERASARGSVSMLTEGKDVALVSDAGMPVVNDPGYRVVAAAMAASCTVRVIPGPSATLTALVLSNFPAHEFVFVGFPPRKEGQRRNWLQRLANARMTIVAMEAATRLPALLIDAHAVLGDIHGAVALELTKRFERTTIAPLSELIQTFTDPPKGEVMVVLDVSSLPKTKPTGESRKDPITSTADIPMPPRWRMSVSNTKAR
jgi:16S rRNA (cytidine1402-2'-O)-methyltransferase